MLDDMVHKGQTQKYGAGTSYTYAHRCTHAWLIRLIIMKFLESLFCTRPGAKCFICITSLSPPPNPYEVRSIVIPIL